MTKNKCHENSEICHSPKSKTDSRVGQFSSGDVSILLSNKNSSRRKADVPDFTAANE